MVCRTSPCIMGSFHRQVQQRRRWPVRSPWAISTHSDDDLGLYTSGLYAPVPGFHRA